MHNCKGSHKTIFVLTSLTNGSEKINSLPCFYAQMQGLTLPQLVQAVQVLLSQGENAQRSTYAEWLERSAPFMTKGTFFLNLASV
jgi:hypothetical protein